MQNGEEVNKYYALINSYVDEYTSKWKVSPVKLKLYLEKSDRLLNFLKRKGLENIKLIKSVIDDVINDRISIEKDRIVQFESFQLNESLSTNISSLKSCLTQGIDKSNSSHEKILADIYDVSLSEIDIIDPIYHRFKINNEECIIYTDNEVEIIMSNIEEYCIMDSIEKEITIQLGSSSISIPLSDTFEIESLRSEIRHKLDKSIKPIILSILETEIHGELEINPPSHGSKLPDSNHLVISIIM